MYRILSLQVKPALGRTKPSTGSHVAGGPRVGHTVAGFGTSSAGAKRRGRRPPIVRHCSPATSISVMRACSPVHAETACFHLVLSFKLITPDFFSLRASTPRAANEPGSDHAFENP